MCIKTQAAPQPPNPAQATPGQANTVSPPYAPNAPQLSVAVNTSKPPEPPQTGLKTDEAATITAILKQIYGRLKGGLDPVWQGPDGHDPEWEPQPDMPDDIKKLVAAEEKWARLCSELLVGASYGSTTMYGAWKEKAKGRKDEEIPRYRDSDYYRQFWTSDPVLPIYMACQQLCTFALLTRGLSTYDVSGPHKKNDDAGDKEPKGSIGVSAGHNSYLSHLFQGGWDTKKKHQDIGEAITRKEGPLTPGSLFGFLPPGEGQPQGSHVVFVLRASYGKKTVQFLDTGAARAKGPGPGRARDAVAPRSMQSLGDAGNYDNCLAGGNVDVYASQRPIPFVGFGALKPRTPDDLERGTAQGKLARPLGFARLAIFKRTDRPTEQDILYVSPLVLMYEQAPDANYPPSRYLWSLRAMPACDVLQALWILRIPQGEFAGDLIQAGRSRKLADLMQAPGSKAITTALWWSVHTDGCAYLHLRYKILSTTLANGKTGNENRFEGVGTPVNGIKERGNDVFAAVTAKLESLEPGKDYISPSLQGKVEPPDYFKPW